MGQLVRFGLVGVLVNLALYSAYLAMARAHLGVKLAMSLAYACGVTLSFVFNRRWTFRQRGPLRADDVLRFLVAYLAGYLLNFSALALLVDELGWAHQAVQAAMVFVVAGFVFLLQKHWVFRPSAAALRRP